MLRLTIFRASFAVLAAASLTACNGIDATDFEPGYMRGGGDTGDVIDVTSVSAQVTTDKSGAGHVEITSRSFSTGEDAHFGSIGVCRGDKCVPATSEEESIDDFDGSLVIRWTADLDVVTPGEQVDVKWSSDKMSVSIPKALEITSPADGATLSAADPVTITWNGADPEAGEVRLHVLGDCTGAATDYGFDAVQTDTGAFDLDPGALKYFTKGQSCALQLAVQRTLRGSEPAGSAGDLKAVWRSVVNVNVTP